MLAVVCCVARSLLVVVLIVLQDVLLLVARHDDLAPCVPHARVTAQQHVELGGCGKWCEGGGCRHARQAVGEANDQQCRPCCMSVA
jgi:hypothetical protein